MDGPDVTPCSGLFAALRARPARSAHFHVHQLPAPSLLGSQPRVRSRGDPAGLSLKLVPRREPALGQSTVVDRGADGTAGLGLVGAVTEPTVRDERFDVAER